MASPGAAYAEEPMATGGLSADAIARHDAAAAGPAPADDASGINGLRRPQNSRQSYGEMSTVGELPDIRPAVAARRGSEGGESESGVSEAGGTVSDLPPMKAFKRLSVTEDGEVQVTEPTEADLRKLGRKKSVEPIIARKHSLSVNDSMHQKALEHFAAPGVPVRKSSIVEEPEPDPELESAPATG